MKTNRPKIKVPLEPLDIILEITSLSLLAGLIIYTYLEFQELPDTIPTHFNSKGEVDGFGNKSRFWFLPGLGILIYVGVFIMNQFPYLHKYMVNITKENAYIKYRNSTRMMRFAVIFVLALFLYIQHYTVMTVHTSDASLSAWLAVILSKNNG